MSLFTSRATEFGRGTKTKHLSDAPLFTPGPGAYTVKSNFINEVEHVDTESKELSARRALSN